MSSFDLLIYAVLALVAFRAYQKGLILEIFSLLALVVALLFGMKLAQLVAEMLQKITTDSRWIPFVSYLIAFAGLYIMVFWLGKLVEGGARMLQLGMLNKILGAALGVLKVLFFVSMLFWLGDQVKMIPETYKEHSFLYQRFRSFAPGALGFMSDHLPFMKNMVHDSEKLFTHDGSVALAAF